MTLTDFLLERIAEDEAQFRDWKLLDDLVDWQVSAPATRTLAERGLAEAAAKRRIAAEHPVLAGRYCATCGEPPESVGYEATVVDYPCLTLRLIATVYADHPDYRQEWRA